jgi:type III pantothenate kinase
LIVDIGNSDVVVGAWADGEWLHQWRLPSDQPQPNGYAAYLAGCLAQVAWRPGQWRAVVSSVVPSLTLPVTEALAQLGGQPPLVLGPAVYPALGLTIPSPGEIGPDLVANALATHTKFGQACIVVDFGTALTFTVVSGQGAILGVNIAPGLRTALKSLWQNTAKLPEVPLEYPASAVGRNTIHAIQAGVLIGYKGLVEAVLAAIRAELGEPYLAVATGGLVHAIPPLRAAFHAIEPTLTLDGIRLAGEKFWEAEGNW